MKRDSLIAFGIIPYAVSVALDIPVSDIFSDSRQADRVLARHIAIYLTMLTLEDPSPSLVGRMYGRNHSVVLYAVKRIEYELEGYSTTREAYQKAVTKLVAVAQHLAPGTVIPNIVTSV